MRDKNSADGQPQWEAASHPSADGRATQTASAKSQIYQKHPATVAAIRLRQPPDDGLFRIVGPAVARLIP